MDDEGMRSLAQQGHRAGRSVGYLMGVHSFQDGSRPHHSSPPQDRVNASGEASWVSVDVTLRVYLHILLH